MFKNRERMMGLSGIVSAWRDWIGFTLLVIVGFVFLPTTDQVRSIRERHQQTRCRDQMEMILQAERKHYLDHNSFTTVQRDLNRYEAFAPYARCPLCNEPYRIEITPHEIWVQCPCSPGLHGWKHAVAPIRPEAPIPEEDPSERRPGS